MRDPSEDDPPPVRPRSVKPRSEAVELEIGALEATLPPRSAEPAKRSQESADSGRPDEGDTTTTPESGDDP
jgi:hypothetical protein